MRRAGMLVPGWCLRRQGDLGIGDTTALRKLIDWAADARLGFLQLLPINETGADHSPYNAISSVALEPALLDLSRLPELTPDDLAEAAQMIGRKSLQAPLVDYPAVKRAKRMLLERAFERFCEVETERPSQRSAAFQQFREEEADWLDNYCLFRWLMTLEGGSEAWDFWSINYNRVEIAREWVAGRRRQNPEAIEKALALPAWIQWIAFTQWRELRQYAESRDVKLMGDVPIGVSFHSADVFCEPQWFDLKWSGGAPPETAFRHDPFACRWGQNWGIPLYRWEVLREHDFAWWRRRIEKLTDVFQIFRIDHILGLYRIFAFPWRPGRNREFLHLEVEEVKVRTGGELPRFLPNADDTPANKKANLNAGDEYLRVIIEAAGENEVVGEDLGAVPDYVRPHLAELGVAGFKICHWEVEEDKEGVEHPLPGPKYDECSFATFATHDHDPIPAMWEGYRADLSSRDEEIRKGAIWNLRVLSEFAGIPVAKNHNAFPAYSTEWQWQLLRALFDTKARYAGFMITDLFGLKDRFNLPATVGNINWAVRLPFTVEEMSRRDDLLDASHKLQVLIHDTKR